MRYDCRFSFIGSESFVSIASLFFCCVNFLNLRNNGDYIPARKCFNRLLSFLEVLFFNPEVSDIVRENLIELQFKRATELKQRFEQNELLEKIGKELKIYHGKRKEEFQARLNDFTK